MAITRKKRATHMADNVTEPITVEATVSEDNLRAKLEEIKSGEGVIGYILRNTHSATIDLKDPTKLIDYAILSSSAIDASEELSGLFDLGNISSIVVEGKSIKMLSLTVDENKISIFVEKNVDCEALRKTLCIK
jgi:predicted regulator of Ras-like GTPase activity (Roadblock/LC7/MglB family)